jgi:RHS repeat-associated protein
LANGIVLTYGYDNDSRINSMSYQLGTTAVGSLTYQYDAAGRRTQMGGSLAATGFPQAVSSAAYDVANELTNWNGTTISYDPNGNIQNDGVAAYSWNGRNQLITRGTTSLQYDSFGRRTLNPAGNNLFYEGPDVSQELSGGTPMANRVLGGIDQFFDRSDATGTYSPITDALGSVLALTNSSGNVTTQYSYDPFGGTTTAGSINSSVFQYTARENDGNGLYYYRARYYSPTLGRFISEDPLGFSGHTVNVYEYAYDNATNLVDPSGEQSIMLLEDPIIIDSDLVGEAQDIASPGNSLEMPDGGRLDLPPGSSHFDPGTGQEIPTPHVHDPMPPFDSPYENFPRGLNRVPRQATSEDLARAIEHNKSVPFLWYDPRTWGRQSHSNKPTPTRRPYTGFPSCPLCPPPRWG